MNKSRNFVIVKMEVGDRRPCLCETYKGQLVARRTFFEHEKRRKAPKRSMDSRAALAVDPLDADISSFDNEVELSSHLLDQVSSRRFSDSGDSSPPSKRMAAHSDISKLAAVRLSSSVTAVPLV